MRWLKKIRRIELGLILLALVNCGVKGDPVPPEKPPELGRGHPTYKRATEDIKIEKHRSRVINPNHPAKEDTEDDDQE